MSRSGGEIRETSAESGGQDRFKYLLGDWGTGIYYDAEKIVNRITFLLC